MKRTKQLLGAVSSIALIALSSAPAIAAGTTAGDPIANTVTVDYQVGGFDQTAVEDTDSFVVDRKVDVTVAETGSIGRTSVSPNQTQAVIQFEVTNLSNDVVDLALTAAVAAGNDFTLTNIKIYSDANGNGIIDGADAEITFLDEVAVDAAGARKVIVTADIPIGATAGQTADIVLTANAHAGGAVGLGAELTDTAGANTAGVDTVLADGAGETDAANEGDFSAIDGYIVASADLSVVKTSKILSDPVGNTFPNAKAIPGAVVEYCIAVSNGTGAALATGVTVSDILPIDLEIDTVYGVFINGSVDGSDECIVTGVGSGTAGGTATNNDVLLGERDEASGTLSDIAADVTRTLYFRSTIN